MEVFVVRALAVVVVVGRVVVAEARVVVDPVAVEDCQGLGGLVVLILSSETVGTNF